MNKRNNFLAALGGLILASNLQAQMPHVKDNAFMKQEKLSAAVTEEVVINQPIEKVWAVVANWGDAYLYTPGLDASRCSTPEKEGLKSKRHCDIGKGSVKEEILLFEPQKRMILQVYEFNKVPMIKKIIVEFELMPEGNKTRLVQTMAYKMPMGKLMKGKIGKGIKDNVHGIKHYIETGDTTVAKDPKQLKKLYY